MGVAGDGVLDVAGGIVEAQAYEDLVEEGPNDRNEAGPARVESDLLPAASLLQLGLRGCDLFVGWLVDLIELDLAPAVPVVAGPMVRGAAVDREDHREDRAGELLVGVAADDERGRGLLEEAEGALDGASVWGRPRGVRMCRVSSARAAATSGAWLAA